MVSFIIERTNNKFSPFYSELLRDLRALLPSLKKKDGNANFSLVFLCKCEPGEATAAEVSWQNECSSWANNNYATLTAFGIKQIEWTSCGVSTVKKLVEQGRSEDPELQYIIVLNEGSVEPLLEGLNSKSNLMQLVTLNNYRRHDVR